MAQKYCYQIGEWVQDNVSQHVEQCVEQDCAWWCACCNKWLCALVWVVVTVLKWVVQTVCGLVFWKSLGGVGGLVGDSIRAIGCGLIGEFRDSVNKWRLRGYVEDLIGRCPFLKPLS